MKFLLSLFAFFYICKAEMFEGDIVLDSHTSEIVNGKSAFDAIKSETSKWPKAVVPYVFSSEFENSRRDVVKQAIADYNKYTCIRWVPKTNQRNYIKFVVGGGCYSYIGMTGGAQIVSIGSGCEYKGIVIHEMMHALGFWHEQSRLDRDNYIKINWENVASGRANFNFMKYTHGEADYYGEGYDFNSVMHYGNWAFSTNRKKTIEVLNDPKRLVGQREGFSQTDVRQLNKVYKCKGYENIKVPRPNGCKDKFDECAKLAKLGHCKTRESFMLQYCCQSCKNTGTGSSCKDERRSCKALANSGYCKTQPDYMLKYCKKSCNSC